MYNSLSIFWVKCFKDIFTPFYCSLFIYFLENLRKIFFLHFYFFLTFSYFLAWKSFSSVKNTLSQLSLFLYFLHHLSFTSFCCSDNSWPFDVNPICLSFLRTISLDTFIPSSLSFWINSSSVKESFFEDIGG